MHRPLSSLSAQVTRFFVTAIVLLPPQANLVAAKPYADPDRNIMTLTATLAAQDVQPIEPFKGVGRG